MLINNSSEILQRQMKEYVGEDIEKRERIICEKERFSRKREN
jgi:hypothetical protein